MVKVNYFGKVVIGEEEKGKDVKMLEKLSKIYKLLKLKNADEINFRLLSFEKLVNFVDDLGYDKNEINYENIAYELKYDSTYSFN